MYEFDSAAVAVFNDAASNYPTKGTGGDSDDGAIIVCVFFIVLGKAVSAAVIFVSLSAVQPSYCVLLFFPTA